MAEIKYYEQWIKRCFKPTQWNNFYSPNSSYCFLNKDQDGVWAGFLIGTTTPKVYPFDCIPIMGEELRRVDEYRRASRIYPTPFEIVEKQKAIKEEILI